MGRKGFTGLSLLLTAAVLTLPQAGCRDRQPAAEISASFVPSGEERSRELGIYLGEERVGDIRFGRAAGRWQGKEGVVRLTETVRLRLSFRQDLFSISSTQISYIDEDLSLLASLGSMDFGAGSWETRVLRIEDGIYEREQVAAGSRSRDRLSVPGGLLMTDALPLYMERLPSRKGERLDLRVFNTTLGQELPLSIESMGNTESGRLFIVAYWGMEERIWIDESGMIVREEMALGVSARAPQGTERTAHLPLERILTQTAVPGREIPPDLGTRERALLQVEGTFRRPPDGRWQRAREEDGFIRISLERPVVPPPGQRAPDMKLMPRDAFGLDLDSGRIQDLSQEITRSLEDPWEKALAIGEWVNRELGKSMRECFTALQVLETGEGECQSHSLLTVALMRAAGLPSQFAYGVVYLPERKAFGFHTWVTVHVGEWVPMDPTLGNFPAGVDHLTLAVGGYQDQFRLFPYIMGQGGWRIKYSE